MKWRAPVKPLNSHNSLNSSEADIATQLLGLLLDILKFVWTERLWRLYCYTVHARNIQREIKKASHSCVPTQESFSINWIPQSPQFVIENTSEVGKNLSRLVVLQ